jgi:hypothetical protein
MHRLCSAKSGISGACAAIFGTESSARSASAPDLPRDEKRREIHTSMDLLENRIEEMLIILSQIFHDSLTAFLFL